MPCPTIQSATEPAIAAAVQALRDGQLLLMPTETVAGVAALAARRDAVDRLFADRVAGGDGRPADRPVLAWHAPDRGALHDLLGAVLRTPQPAVHRRLIERLSPGPVQFAIELDEPELADALTWLGVPRSVCDQDNRLFVRISSHPVAASVLGAAWNAARWVDGRSESAVIVRSVWSIGAGTRLAGVEDALSVVQERLPVEMAIDGPPAPGGQPSTLLVLERRGGYHVARAGAYEERYINKQLNRKILFVCTGNTCRSPMAEAIARTLIAQEHAGSAITTEVGSAGSMASDGMPASAEVAEALASVGMDYRTHSSRQLTRQMIQEADVIYGLTASHVDAVLAMDASAAAKTVVLDPRGRDVPDPIGGPQRLYNDTAAHLLALIRERLNALEW